jgi:hypothetical protein
LVAMRADAVSDGAGMMGTCVDISVQTLGQPSPALTHCELWIGEEKAEDDNHFGQYLGQMGTNGKLSGSLWTSQLDSSKQWYANESWVAVPVFAVDAETRVRSECEANLGTPYPSKWTLFDYPWSVWPLRSFSGWFLSDEINAPAHCAALTARILRRALQELCLRHGSHWYGPSSLYLELSTPYQMRRALELQRPPGVQRSTAADEADDALLATLIGENDETVAGMSATDSRRAVYVAAIKVLQAGSTKPQVDQDEFLESQKNYARAMFRHTWIGRKARRAEDVKAEAEVARSAAEAAEAATTEAAEKVAKAAELAEEDAVADAAAVADAISLFCGR